MAAGWLAEPGTVNGVCVEICKHRDCTAIREIALARCWRCKEPIGFEHSFYDSAREGTQAGRIAAGQHEYVHALCEETAIEAQL